VNELDTSVENEAAPDVTMGGLQLWVYGREFPDSDDEWDGNWLMVRARCSAVGASVQIVGPYLDTLSFHRWRGELHELHTRMEGMAVLESVEPNLRVLVTAVDRRGHLAVDVEISTEPLQQKHSFQFDADQSYLPSVLVQIDSVLRKFGVRHAERRSI
jgi:hypothetical protein